MKCSRSVELNGNNDFCAECGLVGDLLCCDYCPKSFHKKCLSKDSKKEVAKETILWKCSFCLDCKQEFSFLDVDSSSEYYKYLRTFDADLQDSDDQDKNNPNTDYMPAIGLVLLSMEWLIALDQLPDVAKSVAKYFNCNEGKYGSQLFNSSIQSAEFHRLIDELRNLVDPAQFDDMYTRLVLRKDSMAVGLASSCRAFAKHCESCRAFRYLRSFCFNCGQLFNIAFEIRGDLQVLMTNKKGLRKLNAMSDTSAHRNDDRNIPQLAQQFQQCVSGEVLPPNPLTAGHDAPAHIPAIKRRRTGDSDEPAGLGTKHLRQELYRTVGLRGKRQIFILTATQCAQPCYNSSSCPARPPHSPTSGAIFCS